MQGKIRDEERLTEDEIARRKLGPRGVPGQEDSAKLTPEREKNLPKEGVFDGHVADSSRRRLGGMRRRCFSSKRFSEDRAPPDLTGTSPRREDYRHNAGRRHSGSAYGCGDIGASPACRSP